MSCRPPAVPLTESFRTLGVPLTFLLITATATLFLTIDLGACRPITPLIVFTCHTSVSTHHSGPVGLSRFT